MKILIILPSGRAAPYVMLDLAEAFEDLGHEPLIMPAQEFLKMREEAKDKEGLMEFCRSIMEMKADVVFGYGATPIFHVEVPEEKAYVNIFETLRIPYVSIYYDSPFHEMVFGSVAPLHESELYHMFVWDKYYVEELEKLGFKHVYYMPIAANTKRYHKINEQVRESNPYKCDLSFVGSWSPKRDIVMRQLLSREPAIYGYDWEQASPKLAERFAGKADNMTELPQLYNFSKINVNVTMEQGITSLNMRVFDVMACEGFLITDYKSDLEELFDIDKEVVCFRHLGELPELVDYYLAHDDERREKARLGRRRVLREHTYKKRAEYILATLKQQGVG